jgi:hypothetical protein
MAPIGEHLKKAMQEINVKAHTRRTKTGKVSQVKPSTQHRKAAVETKESSDKQHFMSHVVPRYDGFEFTIIPFRKNGSPDQDQGTTAGGFSTHEEAQAAAQDAMDRHDHSDRRWKNLPRTDSRGGWAKVNMGTGQVKWRVPEGPEHGAHTGAPRTYNAGQAHYTEQLPDSVRQALKDSRHWLDLPR